LVSAKNGVATAIASVVDDVEERIRARKREKKEGRTASPLSTGLARRPSRAYSGASQS
jgi:hypothetical protein